MSNPWLMHCNNRSRYSEDWHRAFQMLEGCLRMHQVFKINKSVKRISVTQNVIVKSDFHSVDRFGLKFQFTRNVSNRSIIEKTKNQNERDMTYSEF